MDVVGGRYGSSDTVRSADPAPLGSVFKLYLLTALAASIQSGELAWTDEIVIRDDLKNLPTGIIQDRRREQPSLRNLI